MVALFPASVTLNTLELPGVESVVVNRSASRLIVEHSDLGPHPAFIDAPERRTQVVVRRRVQQDEPSPAKPGDAVTVALSLAESAAPARLRRFSAACVVSSVTHDAAPGRAVIQVITLLAWSTDGVADPVTETTIPA